MAWFRLLVELSLLSGSLAWLGFQLKHGEAFDGQKFVARHSSSGPFWFLIFVQTFAILIGVVSVLVFRFRG